MAHKSLLPNQFHSTLYTMNGSIPDRLLISAAIVDHPLQSISELAQFHATYLVTMCTRKNMMTNFSGKFFLVVVFFASQLRNTL